jgi:hypothetical protein
MFPKPHFQHYPLHCRKTLPPGWEADAQRTYQFFATKPVLLYNCFALGASLGFVVKKKIDLRSFHFEMGVEKNC